MVTKEVIHQVILTLDPAECKKLADIMTAVFNEDLTALKLFKKEALDIGAVLRTKL